MNIYSPQHHFIFLVLFQTNCRRFNHKEAKFFNKIGQSRRRECTLGFQNHMASETDDITMIPTGIKNKHTHTHKKKKKKKKKKERKKKRKEKEKEKRKTSKPHIYKEVLKPTYSEPPWIHNKYSIADPNINQQLVVAHDSRNFTLQIRLSRILKQKMNMGKK